jgi:cold shock protein|uniref:CSD domain-containing protein n=1 Tax=viral metagenome TaxID=1070528 RepID=A0A6C0LXA6_9ZZZZ
MSTSQNDANATPAGDESSRQLGIVKWFNNKAGFGFVTTLEDSGKDIFVHHTGVSVDREQYKYLVQGEYVEFDLSKSENSEHEWQAVNVKGVRNGPLMCETRFLNRQEREQNNDGESNNHGGRNRDSRPRGGGPRSGGHRSGGPRSGGPRSGGSRGDNPRRNAQRWVLDEANKSSNSVVSDGHE